MTDQVTDSRPMDDPEALRAAVRERYAEAALTVLTGAGKAQEASCCAPSCCTPGESSAPAATDVITRDLYDSLQAAELPEEALRASLGCGNPTLLAQLHEGEVVLDLGSGGGIDVLLSAKRVGPTGFAYGLDMTDEMLALAEHNRRRAGAENVRFLKGTIEHVPLPDATVDVIISNCVINLSTDKDATLSEAFRVLKPGGRFAISDIVFTVDAIPVEVRRSVGTWSGCIGGALTVSEYREKLESAGFEDVSIEITRPYRAADLGETVERWLAALPAEWQHLRDGAIAAAAVRATKPAA